MEHPQKLGAQDTSALDNDKECSALYAKQSDVSISSYHSQMFSTKVDKVKCEYRYIGLYAA